MKPKHNHEERCTTGVPILKGAMNEVSDTLKCIAEDLQSGDYKKEEILQSINLCIEAVSIMNMVSDGFLPDDLLTFGKTN